MIERHADIWIGITKRGVIYSRTAAGVRWLCKDLCKGYKAHLTPVKAKISFKMEKRKR